MKKSLTSVICLIFVAFSVIFLFSCQTKQKQELPKPNVDLSTPDKTVISYMTYAGYLREKIKVEILCEKDKFFTTNFREHNNKLDKKHTEIAKEKDVRIDSVKTETDSRVIIFLSNFDAIMKERQQFRVILNKINNTWLIDEIYEKCSICKGTGKEKDYLSKTWPPKMKICDFCKGKGWRQITFLPNIPYK
jgi:hypothetical protein